MTEQRREAFEKWVLGQFPGYALDEIDPGALDLARAAYVQGALSHAEGEAVPVDIDAEYEAFCRWCRESGFNLDYRLHTHSGRRVSDGRNSDRESQQTWEEAAYFAKQEAKRLRAGKEGEES